ncbi:MAG: hypothetical protein J6N49_05505 [Alphaproteobacteria bacterium]|nr:hypothetical protein [Alphaproteobacteria bacterium]
MRFVLALVRMLGIFLSVCLFCAFLYFGFINQQSENAKIFSYGSLILFVFSTVITSLVSVGFENYQNKKQDTAFFNKINDKLQEIHTSPQTATEPQEDHVTPFLEKLTADGSNTAEAIHLGFEKITKQLTALQEANPNKNVNFGFESINNRLNEIQQASTSQTEQIFSSLAGITALPEQISSLITNISSSSAGGNTPEMEVLQQTVSQIGTEMGQNNTQTVNSINKLESDLADLRTKQQDAQVKLDDIITKLDYLLPVIQELADKGISVAPIVATSAPVVEPAIEEASASEKEPTIIEPVVEEAPAPAEEPVVIEPVVEEEAPAPEEEPVVIEPIVEEAPAPEEEPVVIEPIAEEEPAPAEEPAVIEPIAEEEPAPEEEPVVIEPIAEEKTVTDNISATEDIVDLNTLLNDTDVTPMSLDADDTSWSDTKTVAADHPEYEASDPFGTPAKHNISRMLPEIEGKTDPATYASETPFGNAEQGSTEGMPDLPAPTNPALLESDDPYGVPNNDVTPEVPIDRGELQADNPFGVPPSETKETPADIDTASTNDHSPLDAIFNDKFAAEMADLDILKDDANIVNKNSDDNLEEIDISAMFNETQK